MSVSNVSSPRVRPRCFSPMFPKTGESGTILVKLGLHCGPCIAVTLNDRLDYFGRTVNLAARLQGESRGGDIVLSQAMANDPALATLLESLAPVPESAFVKGFPEPVPLLRLPMPENPPLFGGAPYPSARELRPFAPSRVARAPQ
jgi:class 3 adenylate cyclase